MYGTVQTETMVALDLIILLHFDLFGVCNAKVWGHCALEILVAHPATNI